MNSHDQKWMQLALAEARKAHRLGEVPVGAVLVHPKGLIAKAHNLRESLKSPLGHAELLALHRGAKRLGSWRLEDCTLYVTLEPCAMCAGAIAQSRVGRVVYAAKDLKPTSHNHLVRYESGLLEDECSQLLSDFFEELREEKKPAVQDRHVSVAIVFHNNMILSILAEDPLTKKRYHFLPGGQQESGESKEETCLRETAEETGYKIRLIEGTHFFREYIFEWNGISYRRKTDFFCAELAEPFREPEKQNDAAYNLGPQWVPMAQADRVFSYHPAMTMSIQKALKIWRKNNDRKRKS